MVTLWDECFFCFFCALVMPTFSRQKDTAISQVTEENSNLIYIYILKTNFILFYSFTGNLHLTCSLLAASKFDPEKGLS